MDTLEIRFKQAKDRFSIAAARCLAGDRSAIKEADEAMSEVNQLRRETIPAVPA